MLILVQSIEAEIKNTLFCYICFLVLFHFLLNNALKNYLFQLYKIMNEHKNPKVLSEGLLWMVSAVEDFGASHLKLKVFTCLNYFFLSPIIIFYITVSMVYLYWTAVSN